MKGFQLSQFLFVLSIILLIGGVIATLAWAAFRKEYQGIGAVAVVAFVFAIAALVGSCFRVVPANSVGIPVTFGKIGDPMKSGPQFVLPWTKVHTFSTRIQEFTMRGDPEGGDEQKRGVDDAVDVRGSDEGVVYMDVTVRYTVEQAPAGELFKRFRSMDDIRDKLVLPDARSVLRDASKDYPSTDLVAQERSTIEDLATEALTERMEAYGVKIDAVLIRGVRPSQQVAAAINAKLEKAQQAEQALEEQRKQFTEAETRKGVAERDAQAAIERANGEAEALRIAAQAEADANAKIAASLTPEVLRAREIEALKEAGAIYVPVDGSMILQVPPVGQ